MELRHLHYFVAVAEELHFGRAARRLLIAQPPLSQQIQKLEEELGVQLFRRTKRRVELTEAGQVFLQEARQALAQVEQAVIAVRRASGGEIGRLTVGFVGSASYEILPALIRRFHERFPDVELVLREATTSQQVRALHEGRIHVGLLRPPISDDSLVVESFLTESLIAALPETHALAGQPVISLQALARERFITFPRHLGPGLYDQIISVCQRAGFSPQITQEAVQMQTILGLVATGIGVALIPASARSLRSAGIAYSELQGIESAVEMALAWRRDNTSTTLCAFLEVARNSGGEK
jgi:DNA-binding transcriptional LysR family regulator